MDLLEQIKENARQHIQRIVLPESYEERTLLAANEILHESIAEVILLGNPDEIHKLSTHMGLTYLPKATIIDHLNSPKIEEYAQTMVAMRGHKGVTHEKAVELLKNPLYYATLMIKHGDADGEVAGAENTTGDVLRPAFHYIKTMPGISVVSGAFIMIMPDTQWGDNGILVFADCAVHPNPTADELAEIAVATAHTARAVAGIEPRVAMLSFSTKGSAEHEMVTKVRMATEKAKQLMPDLQIDGELQADAAIVEAIGRKKAPGSTVAGRANVLVFPTLEVGNIAYKLVERLAGAKAIGPVLQGMAAPVNDLSRGCSANDIVALAAITANLAYNGKKSS